MMSYDATVTSLPQVPEYCITLLAVETLQQRKETFKILVAKEGWRRRRKADLYTRARGDRRKCIKTDCSVRHKAKHQVREADPFWNVLRKHFSGGHMQCFLPRGTQDWQRLECQQRAQDWKGTELGLYCMRQTISVPESIAIRNYFSCLTLIYFPAVSTH